MAVNKCANELHLMKIGQFSAEPFGKALGSQIDLPGKFFTTLQFYNFTVFKHKNKIFII